MKTLIKKIIIAAALEAKQEGLLNFFNPSEIEIKEIKETKYGDFSTNLAMKTAKLEKKSPKEIAKIIIEKIKKNHHTEQIDKIKVISPGFINFFINPSFWHSILKNIHKEGSNYGRLNIGNGKKILIEFVSSNPTGPLHFGHGRGAVVGDVMANIFNTCGYDVKREYYINDFGRQISILGLSIYLRAKEYLGYNIKVPDYCYQGLYIKTIAIEIVKKTEFSKIFKKNKEEQFIKKCANYALKKILVEIKLDLKKLGIVFDSWFSELSLYNTGKIESTIKHFLEKELIYKNDEALWFKTSKFGDEKDRVVVRKNGLSTYFASDIAYHKNKFDRGFESIINVWGADHHGYIPRIKAIVKALGKDENQFEVILVKLVNLIKNNKNIAMSTRAGKFITLEEVVNEVGKDATRFIFLTRHSDSPLNFDIELAKKKNNENPVYYVQYVYARIANILFKAKQKGFKIEEDQKINISQIRNQDEISLIKKLSKYPEIIKESCQFMEPHRLTFYLMELASKFHTYYNNNRVINKDSNLTLIRLYLITAVSKVIYNALNILGVSTPKKM